MWGNAREWPAAKVVGRGQRAEQVNSKRRSSSTVSLVPMMRRPLSFA